MLNFNQEEKRKFLTSAFTALKKHGLIPTWENDIFCEITRVEYHAWGGDIKLANCMALGGGVAAGVSDFLQWLTAKTEKAKADSNEAILNKYRIEIDRIGLEIEIPFGTAGRMKFKAEGKIPLDIQEEDVEQFYADLFAKCWQGFRGYNNHRERFNMGGVERSYQPVSGDTANTFTFTSIVMESKGQERQYKVKGSKFPIHGLRIFPEKLSEAGIDPLSITTEKYITGIATFVNKANGDPHKVVALDVKRGGVNE